jgi:hypothetical protein
MEVRRKIGLRVLAAFLTGLCLFAAAARVMAYALRHLPVSWSVEVRRACALAIL